MNLILVGDFNIAHRENDLARSKNNVNNIMFTSEERAQLNRLAEMGFIDSFRQFTAKMVTILGGRGCTTHTGETLVGGSTIVLFPKVCGKILPRCLFTGR